MEVEGHWPDHLSKADLLVQRVSDDAGKNSGVDVPEAATGPICTAPTVRTTTKS